jgi:hypothetical protein
MSRAALAVVRLARKSGSRFRHAPAIAFARPRSACRSNVSGVVRLNGPTGSQSTAGVLPPTPRGSKPTQSKRETSWNAGGGAVRTNSTADMPGPPLFRNSEPILWSASSARWRTTASGPSRLPNLRRAATYAAWRAAKCAAPPSARS